MDDETIDRPLVPKKPYSPPQLHDLPGSMAGGKRLSGPYELTYSFGPS
jgi:hypothetical protein